jgi:hypothetical protein
MLPDADYVWIEDTLEATFWADDLGGRFLLSVVFDDFPFDSAEAAFRFLRRNGISGTIGKVNHIYVFQTVVDVEEEQLEEAAWEIASRLKWQS